MAEIKKASIKKNYLLSMLYEVVALVVPILIMPYISRVLGAEEIGKYTFTYSIMYYFTLLGSLGFNKYARREIANHRDDPVAQKKIFWEIVLTKFITCSVAIIIYTIVVFTFFDGTDYFPLFLIELGFLIGNIFEILFIFQGNERFTSIVIKNIAAKVLMLASVFIFVRSKDDIAIYTVLQSTMYAVGNLLLWIDVPKFIWDRKNKIENFSIKRHFIPALKLLIPAAAYAIYTMIDKTFMGVLITETITTTETQIVDGVEQTVEVTTLVADVENGVYDQTEKVVKMLVVVLTTMAEVATTRVSYYKSKNDTEQINKLMNKSLDFVFLLSLPMIAGILCIATDFCPVYFGTGQGFEKAANLMMLMSPLILFIGVSCVFGMQYLVAIGKDNKYIIGVCVGAITNVIINLILIPKLYSYGAVIGTVVAEFIIAVVMFLFVRKDFKWKRVVFSFLKYFLFSAIMFVCVFPMRFIDIKPIYRLIIQVLTGFAVYGVLLLVSKDQYVFGIFRKIFKRKPKIAQD